MATGLEVVVLSTRELIRVGLHAVLSSLEPSPWVRFSLDSAIPADLIIVDVAAGDGADLERLRSVVASSTAPVLVLTAGHEAPELACWPRPAHALVAESASRVQLLTAVTDAVHGSAPRPTRPGTRPTEPLPAGLSHRELEVLNLIGDGLSNSEIAEGLFLGINTIKTHIRTAYRKIGVTSRTQAVLWTLHHGTGSSQASPASDPVDAGRHDG